MILFAIILASPFIVGTALVSIFIAPWTFFGYLALMYKLIGG